MLAVRDWRISGPLPGPGDRHLTSGQGANGRDEPSTTKVGILGSEVKSSLENKKGARAVHPLVRVAPGGSIDDRWTTCGALERRGAVAHAHDLTSGHFYFGCRRFVATRQSKP